MFVAQADDAQSDAWSLEVELAEVGTPFANISNMASEYRASANTVYLHTAELRVQSRCHWQYRLVDERGGRTAWTPFGGNGEDEADFEIAVAENQGTGSGAGSEGESSNAAGAPGGGHQPDQFLKTAGPLLVGVSDHRHGDSLRHSASGTSVESQF